MLQHVRDKDLELFLNMSPKIKLDKRAETPYQILIPAFMISELKRAFEIGFLLFIPFLIIDLLVASILMAMGDDDGASGDYFTAIQADFLCTGRRLVYGDGEYRTQFWTLAGSISVCTSSSVGFVGTHVTHYAYALLTSDF